MDSLIKRVKHEHQAIKRQNGSNIQEGVKYQHQQSHNRSFNKIKYWIQNVQPIKLIRVSQQLMTKVMQNWSKFRLNLLKYVNEEQSKIIDIMSKLRKQVQWLNQVRANQTPQLSKVTTKLFKDCQQLIQDGIQIDLKLMMKQTKLISDKILDTLRSIFDEIKEIFNQANCDIKQLCKIKQMAQQKTYFKFLKDQKHSQIIILDKDRVSCRNQSYDMDFGVVAGPMLTKNNNRIGFRIQTNDKYQCFIGVGVCHINQVKNEIYKGTGPQSGCYVIRQENTPDQAIALNHKYKQYGTHTKQKFIGWGFGQGDEILIEIDYSRNYVCFFKGQKYTFQMPIDAHGGTLAGYVVLHSRWDSISIVNS